MLLLCWTQNSVCFETCFGLKKCLMENWLHFQGGREFIFLSSQPSPPPNLPLVALVYTLQFFQYEHYVQWNYSCTVWANTQGACACVHACLCVCVSVPLPSDLIWLLVVRRSSHSLTVTEDRRWIFSGEGFLKIIQSSTGLWIPQKITESEGARC